MLAGSMHKHGKFRTEIGDIMDSVSSEPVIKQGLIGRHFRHRRLHRTTKRTGLCCGLRRLAMNSAWAVVLLLCVLMVVLQFRVMKYNPCPTFYTYTEDPAKRGPFPDLVSTGRLKEVDCFSIFEGRADVLSQVSESEHCTRDSVLVQADYLSMTQDCHGFRIANGYLDHVVTKEEEDFPLAFNIITYENAVQTERLLRAIYRPHNFYCIHVDGKSPSVLLQMQAVASCFDNVVMAAVSLPVYWGHISVMDAELACLRELIKFRGWKYFINLTGRDFPIRTNWELVQIFKAYNGANDVEGRAEGRPTSWTNHIYHPFGVFGYHAMIPTFIPKSPPPHNLTINKGTTHIAASWDFVNFTLHDQVAKDLLEWLRDARVPDEMFWSTLNHNKQLGAPGSFTGREDQQRSVSRVKWWWFKGDQCRGAWIHGICSLGLSDLQYVHKAPQYFINKLHLEVNPIVYNCAEEWYRYRVNKVHNPEFNITFYKNLPHAKLQRGNR